MGQVISISSSPKFSLHEQLVSEYTKACKNDDAARKKYIESRLVAIFAKLQFLEKIEEVS